LSSPFFSVYDSRNPTPSLNGEISARWRRNKKPFLLSSASQLSWIVFPRTHLTTACFPSHLVSPSWANTETLVEVLRAHPPSPFSLFFASPPQLGPATLMAHLSRMPAARTSEEPVPLQSNKTLLFFVLPHPSSPRVGTELPTREESSPPRWLGFCTR